MKVLITGGGGFIGSHLVDRLIHENNVVVVLDEKSRESTPIFSHELYHRGKVEETSFFRGKKYAKFDVIYHLAAIPRIQQSFHHEIRTHEVNVMGTIHMLELAKNTGARFVFTSTSCVYADENLNPYAFSKWIGEKYCHHYRQLHGVKTTILRLFNVYGPRQYEEGPGATVVGIFEKQYREGDTLTITGDGSQRRDFIHVDDVVDTLVAAGELENGHCDPIDVGTGVNYSVAEVARMLDTRYASVKRPKGEAQDTLADTVLMNDVLGVRADNRLETYISSVRDKK